MYEKVSRAHFTKKHTQYGCPPGEVRKHVQTGYLIQELAREKLAKSMKEGRGNLVQATGQVKEGRDME